jgi:hypothetical protein
LTIDRALTTYLKKGYSREWILFEFLNKTLRSYGLVYLCTHFRGGNTDSCCSSDLFRQHSGHAGRARAALCDWCSGQCADVVKVSQAQCEVKLQERQGIKSRHHRACLTWAID